MLTSSSPARTLHFAALAASSASHENSARKAVGVDLSLASITFDSETDLLPYRSRTCWSLGRLMPIGVIGPQSPVSSTTSIALAVIPFTSGLRYAFNQGIWSSNQVASAASLRIAPVFSGLT